MNGSGSMYSPGGANGHLGPPPPYFPPGPSLGALASSSMGMSNGLARRPFVPHGVTTNGIGIPNPGRTITNGVSSSDAIDLTGPNLPSPPPTHDKSPLCIGSIMSRAMVFYPSDAIYFGKHPAPGAPEQWDVVEFRGAELLKVKLKVCASFFP